MDSKQINEEINSLKLQTEELKIKMDRLCRIRDCAMRVVRVFGGESFDIDEENILHVRNACISKSVRWDETWPASFNTVSPLLRQFDHAVIHWSQDDGPTSVWALEHTGSRQYVSTSGRDKMACFDERVHHVITGKKEKTLSFFTIHQGTDELVFGGKPDYEACGW